MLVLAKGVDDVPEHLNRCLVVIEEPAVLCMCAQVEVNW